MKLERLSQNKIKYSITFEELVSKGFLEDGFESFIWHDLFDEMVEVAKEEYQFETTDTISIEIFSLNSKEIILILTIDDISDLMEGVTKQNEIIGKNIYFFESIEDVILLSLCFKNLKMDVSSKLIQFENHYYLIVKTENSESFHLLCEEYGSHTKLSPEFLEVYGVLIFKEKALEMITSYFSK
jgi:adapter protein MecA 1/2